MKYKNPEKQSTSYLKRQYEKLDRENDYLYKSLVQDYRLTDNINEKEDARRDEILERMYDIKYELSRRGAL